MPGAGGLNKRVIFQAALRENDEGGGGQDVWGDDLIVWGEFRPERGRERLEAGRLEAALGGVLRVRSSSRTRDVHEGFRVLIDGEPYQIRSIANPDQRNRFLEMTVEKGVAQ